MALLDVGLAACGVALAVFFLVSRFRAPKKKVVADVEVGDALARAVKKVRER